MHPSHTASAMVIMIVAERSRTVLILMNVPLLWSIGDWEGDTVMGKGLKSALLTMVERKTLYTVIMRFTGKQSGLLAEAAVAGLKALKSNILTITLDNGL
ncbi:MAG: hypothetical protein KZQ60_02640 [Candidatus Thiodiazotropha sp. (ex Lucinoma aequizonata)]|nr:hypothetical protein [Candidatus Thiodiazotropha sp. (ex Lucinoma aequizonata)]MCU7887724.1 hypothetical protein [Candidatus Thiodiazotropha sp. (ex Lucinoma aequizonata)]